MNKTNIEWCDYTINPVKGLCPTACSYCYARRLYKRFKWDETIRLDVAAIHEIHSIKEPSRIFVGSTIELFGDWVEPEWYDYIWGMVKGKPQHTFIFLTKQPQNLSKWSPFPDNCWVGVSVTSAQDAIIRVPKLKDIVAPVKFISFEPLLKPIAPPNQLYIQLKLSGINWIIIGAQTPRSEKTSPKWAWVREIIEAAGTASVPVFLKPNLGLLEYSCEGSAPFYKRTFTEDTWELRQEFPSADRGVE